MIKKNIDIILLIIILLLDHFKRINLDNNYYLFIIILFIEYINYYKSFELFTESSIHNTAILQNIFSIFNEEQVTLKNIIVDGDVRITGSQVDAKDLVILSDKGMSLNGWEFEKKGNDKLLIYNKDVDLNKQSIYGKNLYSKHKKLYVKPNLKYFFNCCDNDPPYGLSCHWRANQKQYDVERAGSCYYGTWKEWTDLYGEIDNAKKYAATKISSKGDIIKHSDLAIFSDIQAGQIRGRVLQFKDLWYSKGRGRTAFHDSGIEQYKENGNLNWSRWPPSPAPPPPPTVGESIVGGIVSLFR